MNKRKYDGLFIIISTIILVILAYSSLLEELAKFALIPLMMAYFVGQYVGRKFKDEN